MLRRLLQNRGRGRTAELWPLPVKSSPLGTLAPGITSGNRYDIVGIAGAEKTSSVLEKFERWRGNCGKGTGS
jgi:hypothetical protein